MSPKYGVAQTPTRLRQRIAELEQQLKVMTLSRNSLSISRQNAWDRIALLEKQLEHEWVDGGDSTCACGLTKVDPVHVEPENGL